MAKKFNTETIGIAKNLSREELSALSSLKENINLFPKIESILNKLKLKDSNIIIATASSNNSMDDLIKTSSEQSFRRGRISLSILLHSLIEYAHDELVSREKKEDNKVKVKINED